MREALRNLTTRGKTLIAVGIALLLASFVIGERDLIRVAALVGLLPLASAALLSRAKYQLTVSRVLDPVRVEAGQRSQVTLRLRNGSRLPTGTLMLEDRLPYALGNRPRLVLERLLGGGGSAVSYSVRSELRGRYEVGPLLVRITDPFGLIEMTRSFPNTDALTVIPSITPMPAIRLPGEFAGSGDNRARSVAVHGEDDAATREYRYGDDLRRVHWPSTARAGELMVRREEQPWDSRATVALDIRAGAHRGEGPTSSFEWAVSATASVMHHLRLSGYKLRMVTEEVDMQPDIGGPGSTLDHLAAVRTQRHGDISRLLEQIRKNDHSGLIVASIGSLTADEAERLGGLRTSGATCVALLIDSMSWLKLSEDRRATADAEYHRTRLTLMRAGWRVLPVRNGERLPELWRGLTQGPQGFAYRAAMAETVSTTKKAT
ncbi:DUF58 domain-containing protein [Stackebrandtia soli]|uniref:DUF58 domain-containing protein n=1 Tax=Stackebrandtia soli TaxID=1892856 RepID=UPI0039EA54D0